MPVDTFGAPVPGRPNYLCGAEAVTYYLSSGTATLASIRTRGEFLGRTSGCCYIDARGEIAGARWGRAGCEGDVDSMSQYQLANCRMRCADDISAMWGASGIDAHQRTGFYCGTSWRAALAFWYVYLMGWEHISVYDGGWLEYSQLGLPVAINQRTHVH